MKTSVNALPDAKVTRKCQTLQKSEATQSWKVQII